jgi:N-acetylmuramoyl-L-alanine amidase
VRRLGLIVLALLVVSPAAAKQPAPTLTLEAPRATTYGHRIDFVGRLQPSVPGARIRLFRGRSFVARTRLRRNGTFHIRVQVARPGPFHVRSAKLSSRGVRVRIRPFLETALIGPRVAGAPLRLHARLRPTYAGALRIRVLRPGRRTFARIFGPRAHVTLGTEALERFRVAVEMLPRRGFVKVSRSVAVALRPPSLEFGAQGPVVGELAQRLRALHYAIPPSSGSFDSQLLQSVYAFQKAQGLPRTGVVDAAFWTRLEQSPLPRPRYRWPSAHIEVDKARQILLLVRNGQIVLISPVSTAGIPGYYTPVGRFAIFRKVPGYDPSPLGVLYKPMYFYAGYAIHGNPSVPPYPASHGCIRVPNFVIERLYSSEPYGEAVYVY